MRGQINNYMRLGIYTDLDKLKKKNNKDGGENKFGNVSNLDINF